MPSRPAGAHTRKPAQKWSADDRELMRADKVLRRVMEEQGPIHPEMDRRGSRPDPYEALARAIVGQQLSTKAAASIWAKLLDQFGGSDSDARSRSSASAAKPCGRRACPPPRWSS